MTDIYYLERKQQNADLSPTCLTQPYSLTLERNITLRGSCADAVGNGGTETKAIRWARMNFGALSKSFATKCQYHKTRYMEV
jgi:hypothetical protein